MLMSFPQPDIDELVAAVCVHQEHHGCGKIIHMHELPQRRPCSPDDDARCARYLCLVELPDQGREHMRILKVIVIIGPVKVGGHHRDKIGAILDVVTLAHLQPRDLRDGVGFVCIFEGPREEVLLADGLRGIFRVDAGAAEEEQLFHLREVGIMDHIILKHQVFVEKLRPVGVVGNDPSHLG